MLQWRDFKTDPPYDAKDDEEAGLETDRVTAYFAFRYTHRPDHTEKSIFVSHGPCQFYDGIFTSYESHMRTSPYECDWIEPLYWIDASLIRNELQKSVRDFV